MFKIIKESSPELKESAKRRTYKRLLESNEDIEELPKEVVPGLRFLEIVARINTILDGFDEVELSNEQVNEIKVDLTRIENAVSNVEAVFECELKNKINEKITVTEE